MIQAKTDFTEADRIEARKQGSALVEKFAIPGGKRIREAVRKVAKVIMPTGQEVIGVAEDEKQSPKIQGATLKGGRRIIVTEE